jgi:hypothetical protein
MYRTPPPASSSSLLFSASPQSNYLSSSSFPNGMGVGRGMGGMGVGARGDMCDEENESFICGILLPSYIPLPEHEHIIFGSIRRGR